MAEQWVNLPKEDRFAEDGITKERCGKVTLEALFEKKGTPIQFKVKVTPGGNNAVYSRKEKGGNKNFRLRQITVGLADDKSVLLEESIYLAAAGGDEYTIEAKDAAGNVVKAAFQLETRRKLYYQVIKMKNMTVTVGTLTSHLEDEYWTPGKKYYVKLKELPSKGEMPEHPNFDVPQQGNIPTLAKAQYSNAKDRFCFALVLVDQLGRSMRAQVSKAVTINSASPTVTMRVNPKYLWVDLDPAGTPEAVWNFGGTFTENNGTAHAIPVAAITANGRREVNVDTSALPNGAQGTIKLDLKLVDYFRTGLSLAKNMICVATRATWTQRADDEMKSTLVHEAGHKVGMVPGGGGGGLAKQSTYYQKNGGHCNFSTNLCVMYGEIHPGRSNRFCSVCEKSVRRLDLDANTLPGFDPP